MNALSLRRPVSVGQAVHASDRRSIARATRSTCPRPSGWDSARQPRRTCRHARTVDPVNGLSGRRRGGSLLSRASSNDSQSSCPFDPNDYIRLSFMPHPYGPLLLNPGDNRQPSPMLTFYSPDASGMFPHEKTPVLEVFIGGDTALCISQLLNPAPAQPHHRPMPLDLLHRLLTTALATAPAPTVLLHVAIVALHDDVFHGRLFLGCPATRAITLDLDCRFSDAAWLALKMGVPMYVHRAVWHTEARALQDAQCYHTVHKAAASWALRTADADAAAAAAAAAAHAPQGGAAPLGGAGAGGGRAAEGAVAASVLNPEAWEEVQLLKKQLEVAVKEEDYSAAIRLRDHPYMQLVARIKGAVGANELEPARALYRELEARIMASRSRTLSLEGHGEL